MPLVPTRLLIINRQLDFAVNVKKSMELIGGYEVAPFTSADTALEYIRMRPQDIALIDFTLRGTPGTEIIAQLRALQPDIAIIATPKNAETLAALRDFDLQDVIDTPIPVRQLIPIVRTAVQHARETLLPDTVEAAPLSDSRTIKITPPEFSSLDQILENVGNLENRTETLEVDMSDVEEGQSPVAEAISVFQRLAAEEPPLPGLEENATIRDLGVNLLDTGERVVVDLLSRPDTLTTEQPLPPDDSDSQPILARKILEGALDHTSPLKPLMEEVALESSLITVVEAVDDDQPTPTDPQAPSDEFSESQLAQMALELTQASLELTAEGTILSHNGEVIASAGSLLAQDLDDLLSQIGGSWDTPDTQARIRFITLSGSGRDYLLFSRRTEDDLTLTMIFAGNMPLRVIRRQSDKLLEALTAVPQASIENTSPENGVGVEAVAAPDLPQAEDSIEAQEDTPETESEAQPSAITPVYDGPRTSYTYVWLMRDPQQAITDAIAQALVAGLDTQLTQRGWAINTLRVHEDYIYLFAQVPGERPANDVIAELKALSAEIITAKVPDVNSRALWADAYLAILPGREIEVPEIQRFIRFGRTRMG